MIGELCRALVDAAQPEPGSLLLEVGTGSGRVTRPLLDALPPGVSRLVGVDLAHDKLCRLASNYRVGSTELVQGDALHLPFPNALFDAIITVHILHLISGWAEALAEFRRLLRPGGVYLRGASEHDPGSIWAEMRQMWQGLLERHGLAQGHADRSARAIDAALSRMGAICTRVQISQRTETTTPGHELDKITARARAGTWTVPGEMLPLLLGELGVQAIAKFASLERQYSYQERVLLDVWRFSEFS